MSATGTAGLLVLAVCAMFVGSFIMKLRDSRRRKQQRDLQIELRKLLKKDERKQVQSADELRLQKLEEALNCALAESKKLQASMDALNAEREKPIFGSSARPKSRKRSEPAESVAQQSTLLPAVFRSGRTGARMNRH